MPQRAILDWREMYGSEDEQLVFSVRDLEVLDDGWRASVGVENHSSIPYELGGQGSMLDRTFGLMLLTSGEHDELEQLDAEGTLPAVRPATRFEPTPPPILAPGESWSGTISAPGPLVADSWVRVVFGTLIPVGTPPEELGDDVTWITDQAHQLRG